jgi:TonB family protein
MSYPFADRRSITRKTSLLIGIFTLLITMSADAISALQSQSGRLSGRLYDPSGSPIENATISVFDPANNVRDIATSNASGVFEFSRLPAGQYELQTSAAGFEPFQIHSVAVGANQTVNLNILSVAAAPVAPSYSGKRVQPVQTLKPGQSSNGITPPKLIRKVDPKYRANSQDQRIVVKVLLDVVVGTDGLPESMRLASGGVDPLLARAAMDAVKQWRYQPAMWNGRPLEQTVRTTVDFFNTEAVFHSNVIEPEINPVPSETASDASALPVPTGKARRFNNRSFRK